MANISSYTNAISRASYGRDVRSAIVDGMNAINDDNESYLEEKEEIREAIVKINNSASTLSSLVSATSAAQSADSTLTTTTAAANSANDTLTSTILNAANASSSIEDAVASFNEETYDAEIDERLSRLEEMVLMHKESTALAVNSYTELLDLEDGFTLGTDLTVPEYVAVGDFAEYRTRVHILIEMLRNRIRAEENLLATTIDVLGNVRADIESIYAAIDGKALLEDK